MASCMMHVHPSATKEANDLASLSLMCQFQMISSRHFPLNPQVSFLRSLTLCMEASSYRRQSKLQSADLLILQVLLSWPLGPCSTCLAVLSQPLHHSDC